MRLSLLFMMAFSWFTLLFMMALVLADLHICLGEMAFVFRWWALFYVGWLAFLLVGTPRKARWLAFLLVVTPRKAR